MKRFNRLLRKALADPGPASWAALAYLRGWFYRVYYPLTGRRFSAGRRLRVEGSLRLSGPGRVSFGDGVVVGDITRLWTYAPGAIIEVGTGSYLNGVHVWCRDRVTIGPRCILGRAEIMDTDFHSTHIERHHADAPVRSAPVIIEANVWIGARAGILPGATIGADSVVGYGAVCSGELERGKIYVGNPARAVKEVPRHPLVPPL